MRGNKMRGIRRFFVVIVAVLAVNAVPVAALADESGICQAIEEELKKYGWGAPPCPFDPASPNSTP